MTKKHQEFVEEIGAILYDDVISHPKVKVRKVITLILSAVRDGLELPGEEGRWKWPTLEEPNEGIDRWTAEMLRTGDEVFIALSGAGKEEEK